MENAELLAVTERIKDTKKELRLQVKTAILSYRVARESLSVAQKGIEYAKENYRITDNQFKQQMATSTDLLDARVLLTRARNDYTNNLYDFHLAIAKIERIVEKDLRFEKELTEISTP